MKNTKLIFLTLSFIAISACNNQAELQSKQTITHKQHQIESFQLLSLNNDITGLDRLVSYQNKGLVLEDSQGKELSLVKGSYSQTDYRFTSTGLLIIAEDRNKQQVAILHYNNNNATWSPAVYLPKNDSQTEGLCLYQDPAANVFAFLIGEEGQGQQWLIADNNMPLFQPALVREMSLPPSSEYCQVDDQQALMFINEEKVGVWAYLASPEAALERQPVAMITPFGHVNESAFGVALVDNHVFIVDPEHGSLQTYKSGIDGWALDQQFDLSTLTDAENLSIRSRGDVLDIAVVHDDGVLLSSLPWHAKTDNSAQFIAIVPAEIETDPVSNMGDSADDPVIWVNQRDPLQSRVIGTNKKAGLLVYDMDGNELQLLAVGRLNNVDLRTGFKFQQRDVDLIIASNRDHNSLHIFTLDPETGYVSEVGQINTESDDIYGLCMFKDEDSRFYAFANDKDGRFFQYQIIADGSEIKGELKRKFSVASQPEGCVVDDVSHTLYLGEENIAVWSVNAEENAPIKMTLVAKAGTSLKADIEGISFYHGDKNSYLIVSSQGNDSYVIFDAKPPYTERGVFRIGLNVSKYIDGASETDGLDVTSHDLGGIWQQGMLVVQDGRNRMPATTQNFKYVPWSSIAAAIGLDEQ